MIDKRKQLRKHKSIATGLFLLMALIYISMILLSENNHQNWIGYVKAFSEAGMVGALADWFAVTALFKYPLGIKIPHTNLINNKKDALGENLGAFVTENFLNQETIRPYVTQIDLSSFIIKWLSNENNLNKTQIEIQHILQSILSKIDDKDVISLFTNKGKEIIADLDLQNLASKGLLYAIENNEHQRLITLIIPQAKEYVENNKESIYKKVVEKNPILGLIGGKAVTNQLISGIISFLEDIHNDSNHSIRNEITLKLNEICVAINEDEDWKIRFNKLKKDFITDEKISEYVQNFWLSTKGNLISSLNNQHSAINKYIEKYLNEIRINLESNNESKRKINKNVQLFIYKFALRNSSEIEKIIVRTVKAWDGKELSEKLELEVGKDLQYIRINGTLVGGLVGLLIYIITALVI